jgi:hypothetical protein
MSYFAVFYKMVNLRSRYTAIYIITITYPPDAGGDKMISSTIYVATAWG